MYEESTAEMKGRWPIEVGKRYFHYLFIAVLITTISALTAMATVTSSGQLLKAQMTGNQELAIELPNSEDSSEELPLNQTFSWQGLISSSPSTLPDRDDTQTALILIPRDDGGVYNGILTYHSTRPVIPAVWTVVSPTNATAVIPEEFGGMSADIISLDERAQVILSALQDESNSGSAYFVGDALELVGEEGSIDEPFIVAYSLSGETSGRTITNDLESISGSNATAVSEN